ncbi:MAG TPA: hypothetical protein VH880_15170 [Anaeromyxobacteraceae bacterium]|jgi:hypothetical protein
MTTTQRLGLATAVLALIGLAVVAWRRDGRAPEAPVLARARAHPATREPPPEPAGEPSVAEVAEFERRTPK